MVYDIFQHRTSLDDRPYHNDVLPVQNTPDPANKTTRNTAEARMADRTMYYAREQVQHVMFNVLYKPNPEQGTSSLLNHAHTPKHHK